MLGSLFRNALRTFDVMPPDAEARAKALKRADECLHLARAAGAQPADQANVPLLEQVRQLLRESPGATAPPLSQPASPPPTTRRDRRDTPPQVWSQPRPLVTPPQVWSQPRPVHPSPRAPSPASSSSSRPPRAPGAPRSPAVADPGSTQALVARLLGRLADLSAHRRTLLQAPLAIWSDLVALEHATDQVIRALTWAGVPATDCLVQALAAIAAGATEDPDAASDDAIFAIALALLRTGRAQELFGCLGSGGEPAVRTSGGAWAALRFAAADHLASIVALAAEPGQPASPVLLDILTDHALITADQLVLSLDSPDDGVAARAAELLAWLGDGRADAQALDRRLAGDLPPARQQSLRFAAALLGSSGALAELRASADAGEPPQSALAIDALVAAGTSTDAGQLLVWATADSPLAALALLAVAHLGHADHLPAIDGSPADLALKQRARVQILGDDRASSPGSAPPRDLRVTRLLRGRPWTRVEALARLCAPDELLCARRWHALEALAYPGTRPVGALDPATPIAIQEGVVSKLAGRLRR